MDVTPHIVVPDADAAAGWYGEAFGATAHRRVPRRTGGR